MPNISARTIKTCLLVLPERGLGIPSSEAARAELERALTPRRIAPRRKAKAKREETSAIRAAVFSRAAGLCERCRVMPPTELSHAFGKGKGRPPESERNTNAFCWSCHHVEAHGHPHDFLKWFAGWAEARGFVAEAEYARARLSGVVASREREQERRKEGA